MKTFRRWQVAGFSLLLLAGCATLDEMAVGQTDWLRPGDFYKTYQADNLPPEPAHIGLLPVTVQPNMEDPDLSYSSRDPVLQRLAEAVGEKISGYRLVTPLAQDQLAGQPGAPKVYLGSSQGDNTPLALDTWQGEYDKYPPLVIYLHKPDAEWRESLSGVAAANGLDYVLRIWVSFAQYPKADRGFFGKKVWLGTGNEQPIRFLSAEDEPVEVLQLSGYLVDRSGRVVRAGAEGVIHHDTPFLTQALGVQKVFDDEALAQVFSAKREDLPGKPLALDVALKQLLSHLTDRAL